MRARVVGREAGRKFTSMMGWKFSYNFESFQTPNMYTTS
jgi:hypothetical protein